MSAAAVGVVDRHVFASNASAYDAAWSTVASTPGLDRVRAGRIEERIPWGAGLELERNAPVLVDEGGLVSPLAQLPLAYLPMDGRAGLSVTGVIREMDGRIRVGTHTLLLDEAVFRAIAGFPLGLFAPGASGVEPAQWFPDFRRSPVGAEADLEPLRIPTHASRAAFEAARLSAVASLAGWAGGRMGEAGARGLLASVYDALARARDDKALVVLDAAPDDRGDRESSIRNVILLAWLSLPLEDRYRTYFSSDGTGASFASPLLVGDAPGDPNHRSTGRPIIRVTPGKDAPPRFLDWARCVMAGATVFGPVSKRVDVRGQSLLFADALPVILPTPFPTTSGGLLSLVNKELAGPARGGALGVIVAEYLTRSTVEEQVRALDGLARIPRILDVARFADGVVRVLARRGGVLVGNVHGARFAVAVGIRGTRGPRGLDLAVRGVTTLLEAGEGFDQLGSLVALASDLDGPGAGAELWRLGLDVLRRCGRYDRLPAYVALLGSLPGIAASTGVVGDLVDAMGEGLGAGEHGPAEGAWPDAMDALWRTLAESGADATRIDLHRLAWQERQCLGRTGLASVPPSPSARRFVHAFVAGDPALPVFLDLRRSSLMKSGDREVVA